MAGLGEWLSGNALGVLGTAYSIYRDSGLTGAEREQNEWNAAQAEKQMQFQASQAEIARDWQEQQYLKYNSPSALVSQYQQAGINPALMFGGSTPSAPQTTSAPSGAMASGSFGSASRMNAVDAVAKLGLLSAQIDNMRADTANKQADTVGKQIANDWSPRLFQQQYKRGEVEIKQLNAGVDKALAEISNVIQDTENKKAQRVMMNFQTALIQTQIAVETEKGAMISQQRLEQIWRNNFAKVNGYYPDTSLRDVVVSLSNDQGVAPDTVKQWIEGQDGALGLSKYFKFLR